MKSLHFISVVLPPLNLAVSEDGHWLATGDQDGTIELWKGR
jgi:WD40 repeat protein